MARASIIREMKVRKDASERMQKAEQQNNNAEIIGTEREQHVNMLIASIETAKRMAE